jgi:SAM-dependent methyltransferase
MNLNDRLHCPNCASRLDLASPTELRCTECDRAIAVLDGVADFQGDAAKRQSDPGDPAIALANLLPRIRAAAATNWPPYLGTVIEIGCGDGSLTQALVAAEPMRGLLAIDTAIDALLACRQRMPGTETPLSFAALGPDQNAIRDATADTILGASILPHIPDLRPFLAMVHRALKPGGRAWFVVPNRRFRLAFCHATAEAVAQRFARDSAWSAEARATIDLLARYRLQLVHQGEPGQAHLFDSSDLEDLAREVGFATAAMIPLDPDPIGAETTRQTLQAHGLPDTYSTEMAPLAASAGKPLFDLLARQDASSAMLLWLTKGAGPDVRIFTARPNPPHLPFTAAHAAIGGPNPRWSIELRATDTQSGVTVRIGGWCLANTDVSAVRVTLGDIIRHAPVWRPRPDVHEVVNAAGLYHPFNALCSGLDAELLFDGLHPDQDQCALCLEVVLANGLVLMGPAPAALPINEFIVVNQ